MDEYARFKATEFRQIVLYTGVVLFKEFLNADAYQHFLRLSLAYRMLSSDEVTEDRIDLAEKHLQQFVKEFSHYYGKNNMGFNVHGLLHLSNDVRLYGTISNFASYPYENYIGLLNRKIRGRSMILEQVSNMADRLDTQVTNVRSYVCDNKRRDSRVILKNGSVAVIMKTTDQSMEVKIYANIMNYFKFPMKSSVLGIYLCSNLSDTVLIIDPEEIKWKCYGIPVSTSEIVVIPLL